MTSTPERTVSSPVEAPVTNKLVLQRLKFKARAPNGKLYTWSQRTKMDTAQQRLAMSKVKQTQAFLVATAQERQDMLDAALEESDEKRRKRSAHTSCMFHDYGIPIIEILPEDLLATPQKTAPPAPRVPSEKKIFKSTEKVSAEDLLDASEDGSDGDDDVNGEEDDYLFSPTMTPAEKWAEIMHSTSSKKPRSNTFSSHSNAEHNKYDKNIIPNPSYNKIPLISSASLSSSGSLSADSSAMLSSTANFPSSLYRGIPLVIIDDDDDETTQDLHTEENPGLSLEWKKMLDM